MNLCQSVSDIRCGVGVSRPPSRAPPNSPYRYDYSNYNFDVVTIEVRNEYKVTRHVLSTCAML